jgi:hypothetical protein
MHAYAGRLRQATELLDFGIAELERHAPNSPALVECYEQKSDLQLTKQEIAAAIVTAQASVAQAQRIFPRARQHWISPRVQLAVSHRAAGHFQIADDMLRETLDLLKELGRERTADAMLLYNTWGIVKADIGDIAGAVRMFEASLGVGHALWGDTTVSQWVSVNYGRRLLLLNKIDAGEENIANALERSSGGRRCGDASRRAVGFDLRESSAGRSAGGEGGAGAGRAVHTRAVAARNTRCT